jgi:hypothetical protein
MTEIAASDYVSGGYYLTRFSARAACMSPELLPDRILSASRCIGKFFPNTWCIEWCRSTDEERIEAASAFGIAPGNLPAVMAWASDPHSSAFGWPNAFYTLEAAREARATLLPEGLDIVIFGLGLHNSDFKRFWRAAKPPDRKPGCAPVGPSGVFECVNLRSGIAEAGDPAGFELLNTEYGLLACSWLCNGLEKVCADRLGIRPNPRGFIDTYAEASRCAEYISTPEVEAEAGLWLPWLVTTYRSR